MAEPIPKPSEPAVKIPANRSPVLVLTARRLVVGSLIVGLIGGGIGSFVFIRYFAGVIPASRQQLVVQENSALVDVAKQVMPSVVSITTKSVSAPQTSLFGYNMGGGTQQGAATGMIVTADGLILTNNHVVDGSSAITVFTSDGKQYKGTIVASNAAQDYAFIHIDATGLIPIKLGNSASVQIGQRVAAIGNALGQYNNTVTDGIISGKGRPVAAGDASGSSALENLQDLFQTDAAINPGNSGGPLVNLDGQVIGMNTAVASSAQNIGFAIPINEIKAAIESVKSKGVIERPYLGVRYVPITPDVVAAKNLTVTSGALITGDAQTAAVVPGSPADKAGLKDGDIITKVGSQTIDSDHSLTSLLANQKVGATVTLTIIRDNKTQTVKATLASAGNQG